MLRRWNPLAAAAAALLLAGCSSLFPDPVVGAQSVLVLTYDPATTSFKYVPQNITTLHNLRTMQGDAAKVYANAAVSVDYNALVQADPSSAAALQAAVVSKVGQPVDFACFKVVSGGDTTIYPEDFDSTNIATTYYNVEQAYLFFEQFNVQLPAPLPVYYFPGFSAAPAALTSETDFGVTDPSPGVLVVPSFSNPDDLPPSMQPGVVAYEYAQAVFQEQVFPGGGLPWLDASYAQSPDKFATAMNVTRGIRAGFSDFFAAVIAADPAFVHTTGTTIDPDRRLDPPTPRCLTAGSQPATTPRATYDPHQIGSILAAVLWHTEVTPGIQQTPFNQSVVTAMQAFGQRLNKDKDSLTLDGALEAIASAISATKVGVGFCSQLVDHFGLPEASIPQSCPTGLQKPVPSCAP